MTQTTSHTTPTHTSAAVVRSVAALRDALAAIRTEGRRVGFVPTMGALHDGHLSLVGRAAEDGYAVVVSVFVNPTQFAPGEDLSRYPRDEAGDREKLSRAGADLVFFPAAEEVYPEGFSTTVTVDGPSQGLEGTIRPTHFAGVATVVTKLLLMVRPDRVVFGQKDAQQVAVVRRLMRDLHLDDIEMVVAPTIRDADGLAMSSRNAYLSAQERERALSLWRGLQSAVQVAESGVTSASAIEDAAALVIGTEAGLQLEYAKLVDADTFTPLDVLDRPAVLCVAARAGSTRLIDNVPVLPATA